MVRVVEKDQRNALRGAGVKARRLLETEFQEQSRVPTASSPMADCPQAIAHGLTEFGEVETAAKNKRGKKSNA